MEWLVYLVCMVGQEWLECLEQNVVALNCDERYNCLGKCIETENVYRQKRYRQKNYRR